MPYRFVHAADVHLDSPLRSLALRNPELGELIGNATRRAFAATIDLCLSERVEALMLAGDLYDGDQTSMKTARFIARQFDRLHQAGIATYVIRGNHDAIARITAELTLPETVRVFGAKADAIEVEPVGGGPRIVVHGLSFAKQHAPEGLLPKYRTPVPDAVNIGLMHTSRGGAPGHDPYAPCSEADLHASGFRYWALGHVHRRAVVDGECTIVMPGMPQGRDVGEAGPKSVSLVTVADDGTIDVEARLTSVAEFGTVVVDLAGCLEWKDAIGSIAMALRTAREAARSEHLVARLSLRGVTPVAWRLRRDVDLLRTEAEHQADLLGRTWIDKVEVGCALGGKVDDDGGGAVGELRRLIGSEVLGSEAFRAEVEAIAGDLMTVLPPECRDVLGADGQAFAHVLADISREGAEDVLARLVRGSDEEGGR